MDWLIDLQMHDLVNFPLDPRRGDTGSHQCRPLEPRQYIIVSSVASSCPPSAYLAELAESRGDAVSDGGGEEPHAEEVRGLDERAQH
jgi:hypothetical protein